MRERTTVRVSEVAASSGDLPSVCVVTGLPTDRVVGVTFTWAPSWTWVLLLFGIVPCLIARWFTAREIFCVLPLDATAHTQYRSRRRGIVNGIAAGIALVIVSAATQTPALAWMGFTVIVGAGLALLWLMLWFVAVEPASEPGHLVVRRAHRRFAAAAGT